MSTQIRRSLTEEEKQSILIRHERKCFATGHSIPEGGDVEFDHVIALAAGGRDDPSNIAPMCADHNKQKGKMSLNDFRTKLRIRKFFEQGAKQTLGDLLRFCKAQEMISRFGEAVSVEHKDGIVVVQSSGHRLETPIYECPTTKWEYFYMTIPVDLIDSDDGEGPESGLQPRYLDEDRVFKLHLHFQRNSVLQPSIGRIDGDRIKIFDGQHKIAGLLWNNRRKFECKIYGKDTNVRRLNEINISAHDNFSQIRFPATILIDKLGGEFAQMLGEYRDSSGGGAKTEKGLIEFIAQSNPGKTSAELMKQFRAGLYKLVLHNEDNQMSSFVSPGNRSTSQHPMTTDMLKKSLFKHFLFENPVDDDMSTENYLRGTETDNLIFLFNLFCEEGLRNWDPDAGPNSDKQRQLDRIFGSKSMIAWSDLLHGSVCGCLRIEDRDERLRPLYRNLSEGDKDGIRQTVRRLMNWQGWNAPAGTDIDRIRNGKQSDVKEWLKSHRLTAGYLIGVE